MRITSGSIQTYTRTGLRNADSQRLPSQPLERAPRQQHQSPCAAPVNASEFNRQVVEHAPSVAKLNDRTAHQRHQIYSVPSTHTHFSASGQAAMQAYTSTQQMSRETLGSGEFLGSIDLFV